MTCDLSVVISNYNTRDLLEGCLRSILGEIERSDLRAEVLAVDDASTDGSSEMVTARFPKVTLIRHMQNGGYARASNTGLRRAAGRAVLLLNSDTVVLPGALPAMLATLQRRKDLAAVGPVLLNPDGTLQRSCWRFPLRSLIGNTFWLFKIGIWDDYGSWDASADKDVDCLSSAALMIRRAVLDDVGIFDENFWVYGVDIDWSLRAHAKGYRCRALAGAHVVHSGKASWQAAPERMAWDGLRSNGLLFRKHYGVSGLALYRGLLLLNAVVRVVFWGVPYLLGNKRLKNRVVVFARLLQWSILGSTQVKVRSLNA